MQRKIQRILIVRTDRIGDVILTLPMARALKLQYPDAHISMLLRRYTAELVEEDPAVDQILFYDDGDRPLPLFQVVAELRKEKFDVVFHTYPRFRAAMMMWLARIPARVGTGYRWYSFLFNRKVYEHRKDARRHELEYNLNLLRAIDCPVPREVSSPTLAVRPEASAIVDTLLANCKFTQLVILHPGSGGSAKDWNARNFGELGKHLAIIPGVKVVIMGGEKERDLVENVRSVAGPDCLPIVGELSLTGYVALAKRAALFVSNSTGPIHIAAAVGTPVIGLYSQLVPLSAARWGPYTEKKTIFAPVGKPLDCARCVGVRGSPCECMDSIRVDDVYSAACQILLVGAVSCSDEALHQHSPANQ